MLFQLWPLGALFIPHPTKVPKHFLTLGHHRWSRLVFSPAPAVESVIFRKQDLGARRTHYYWGFTSSSSSLDRARKTVCRCTNPYVHMWWLFLYQKSWVYTCTVVSKLLNRTLWEANVPECSVCVQFFLCLAWESPLETTFFSQLLKSAPFFTSLSLWFGHAFVIQLD